MAVEDREALLLMICSFQMKNNVQQYMAMVSRLFSIKFICFFANHSQYIMPTCLTVILIYIWICFLTTESVPSCFFELNHCDWDQSNGDYWRMSRLKRPVVRYPDRLFRNLGKLVYAYLLSGYPRTTTVCTCVMHTYMGY